MNTMKSIQLNVKSFWQCFTDISCLTLSNGCRTKCLIIPSCGITITIKYIIIGKNTTSGKFKEGKTRMGPLLNLINESK